MDVNWSGRTPVNNIGKNLALWVIIGLLLVALFNLFQGSSSRSDMSSISFSDFIESAESGMVSDVVIKGNAIQGHYNNGGAFTTFAPNDSGVVDRLTKAGVRISAGPAEDGNSGLFSILLSWFPMLLLIGVWIFFMRQMQGGTGKAMGFGKSRARMLTEKTGRVTFEDVAGIDEADRKSVV